MFTDIWICREKRYRRRYGQCNIKVLENMCFLIVHKKVKSPETVGLTVIRNEITYQLLADGFRVHTKLPSDS